MNDVMRRNRVLVVEDNPKNLKLVRAVLEHHGFHVIEATTGEDGVRLAGEVSPDLILMDLQLPGIDGTETLHRIQSRLNEAMMPVVAVTASAMLADREAAERAGFDGFLEKPINVRALPAQVASYLAGPS